ncbi:flavocytochrome c [Alkalibacter rhizosphaerae]|uniref:Flavocytochrome c n=1 Tax=Alkalibacter rhizosphaerae TaxID=2815577 RepID=A0A974XG42_9FIRM|nr:flavocytochrome c [Alkalibacter rhizosphaerae]QSX09178.1 flavocytochrome c [Alkalibacter rhizosphaerae]
MNMRRMKSVALLIAIFMITGLLFGCADNAGNDGEDNGNITTKQYDVVVLGAGAAGLAAAIEAAEGGASVALLEKLPVTGGSTILSGGIVYGTGSKLHEAAGVEDSVDDLVSYWTERADGKNDPAYLQFVAERSGETIDWLVDMGVEFGAPAPTGISPVARAVTSPEHGGGIIRPMEEYAKSKNVEILLQTEATELLKDENGAVSGVKAVDKDGNELIVESKAVVIATGGFDRSVELVKEYAPQADGHLSFAGQGNEGDGLLMAKEMGANVLSNGGVIGFRAVEGEVAYTTDVCMLMWMPYLYVNKDGNRFVNESIDYPIFYEELIKQPEQVGYLIFDGNTYMEALDKAVEKGSAFKAATLEELAVAAGIDAEQFQATVDNYNEMIANGEDTQFGKNVTGHPAIAKGDFYAVKVIPAILGTMTGIETNLDAEVLDAAGEPIKGLYAAGEVANGNFYNKVYPASGTSIQMCLTFGRVAGSNAASLAE